MRVTSSPAPAVTTAAPSRCRSTVPPPMSITNGVVPARGVVPAPSTAANDSAQTTCTPPGVRSASTSSSPLESPRASTASASARRRCRRRRRPGSSGGSGSRHQKASSTPSCAPAAPRSAVTLPGGGGGSRSSSTPAVPSAKSSRTVVSIASAAGPAVPASRTTSAVRRPATARAAWRAARASSGPRRSSSASCRGSQSSLTLAPGDGDLERRQGAARQDRGVRHLVDDRQAAVEAVADQHGVVALHDHARDAMAALARGAQAGRGVLEVLVQHDREHGLAARGAVQLGQAAQAPACGAGARGRLAHGPHDGVAREVELLQPPELDEPGVDRVELGQQQAVQRLAEPPLGARDELAHARGAGRRALRARRGGPPDAEEVGRGARREPRHGELGRRVADVDARDQHRLFGQPAAHVGAARLAHERGAQRGAARLEPIGELVELARARAAGPQRLVQLEQLLVRERHELGAAAQVVGQLRVAALLGEVGLLAQHVRADADVGRA